MLDTTYKSAAAVQSICQIPHMNQQQHFNLEETTKPANHLSLWRQQEVLESSWEIFGKFLSTKSLQGKLNNAMQGKQIHACFLTKNSEVEQSEPVL